MTFDAVKIVETVYIYLLTFAWIPTIIGMSYLLYVWWTSSRQWFITTITLVCLDVSIAVFYISFASTLRLLGQPPLEWGPFAGATIALLLAIIVPYFAFRIWWALHGGPDLPPSKVEPSEKP